MQPISKVLIGLFVVGIYWFVFYTMLVPTSDILGAFTQYGNELDESE
ncbi:hypothetical protein HY469_00465 [Candidatus Roizmanbacteria bacterium]|nr:hypothetical protein [Candidatus Roizmanbacteria bacterium]